MADDIWPDHPLQGADWPDHALVLPNAKYDALDMAVHGMTFGASDPIRAGLRAGSDYLFGRPNAAPEEPPAGFDFQRRWEEIARGRRAYEAGNPISSTAAGIAGGLTAAPGLAAGGAGSLLAPISTTGANLPAFETAAAAAPGLRRQMLNAAGMGAGVGAVQGALDNPEDPLAGAGSGGRLGAAGGAVLAPVLRAGGALVRGAQNLYDPAATADRNAADRLRGLLAQDTSVGHPDIAALDQRLAGSTSPLTLTDLSPGVQSYVGALHDKNTPAATYISSELQARDAAAQPRILGALDRTAVTGPETFQADAILQRNQKAKAGPLYGDAYMQPSINPDLVAPGGELHALIATPAGQQAMKNAVKIAAQERRSPTSLGIGFNEAGDPVFQGVPSWQTLDYVKRGFDDVINGYQRNPLTGVPQLDTYGRAVAGTLGEYRGILTRENPRYGAALASYSGDQASRDALDAGSHALAPGLPAAEQQHIFNQLSPSDQDFYRLGAANALRLKIRGTADLGDETKRIANSSEMRDKLRPLFGTNAQYEDFVNGVVSDERTMFETNRRLLGGSDTARRVGAMGGGGEGALMAGLPVAAGALMGGAGIPHAVLAGGAAAMKGPLQSAFSRFAERLTGQSPQAQLQTAQMALAQGADARRVLGLLGPPVRPLAPSYLPPARIAGGLAGSGLLGF